MGHTRADTSGGGRAASVQLDNSLSHSTQRFQGIKGLASFLILPTITT